MGWATELIGKDEIKKTLKSRKAPVIREKILQSLLSEYENDGWKLETELKAHYWVNKDKKLDEQFEDTVWSLFAQMGFKTMNKNRFLKIPYDPKTPKLAKQIDVLAVDDETILVVECKASSSEVKGNFKTDIEAMKGYKKGLIRELQNKFKSSPRKKIKFIFATKNYIVSAIDEKRMKTFDIFHLDDNDIHYFSELVNHLGTASRFQFLGAIFRGQQIGAMENKIPAIRGKMGGYTYYSFVIEPSKLLKISYVSHRIDSKGNSAPAYQRLVNKNRIKKIKKFIDDGGFFPNSLIVNLDTGGSQLNFDIAGKEMKSDSDLTRIGILHLPQKYSSAYIIDGQHRLYGYSDSQYDKKNSIPVVAFENLDKVKQIELFMEINENQKKVPKHLQNTLNADLLWDDPSKNNRRKAIRLQVAIELGSNSKSPLYKRIIIEERTKNPERNITIETIDDAFRQSSFLSKFDTKERTRQHGYFDDGNSEQTKDLLYGFIVYVFDYLKSLLKEEWFLESNRQVLITNNSIFGIIKISGDIIEHLVNIIPLTIPIHNVRVLYDEVKYFLDPIVAFFENISDIERNKIKGFYGAGGKNYAWRKLQQVVSEARNEFMPIGLEEWENDSIKKHNVKAYKMLFDIECHLKDTFKKRLEGHYGDSYFTEGVPSSVIKEATQRASDKDIQEKLKIHTTDPWDCLNLIHYRAIARYGQNWNNLFKTDFSYPTNGEDNKSKEANTAWMEKVNKIRNKTHHHNPITQEESSYLEKIHNWLFGS